MSGLQRVALVGDSASGISSVLSWDEWTFLNVDLDVHLSRPVQGEWVLLDARTTLGTHGAALARSTALRPVRRGRRHRADAGPRPAGHPYRLSRIGGVFGFPNPVNEKAARSVAAGVVALCVLTLALSKFAGPGWIWLTVALAYGFLARVATGPRLSPLGQLATRVIAPRLGAARLVPGPPKRFAQAIGATLSVAAAVLGPGLGLLGAAQVLVAMILLAATLESAFAICLGCLMFARLMRLGVIPPETCAACADVSARLGTA